MSPLLGILLRSSALVIAGALIAALLRSQTAAIRHFVHHGVLYGLLLLPVIEWTAPPFRHPFATLAKAELAVFPDQPVTVAGHSTQPGLAMRVTPVPHTSVPYTSWRGWMPRLAVGYFSVAGALLFRLQLGLLYLNRLVSRSEPIFDRNLRDIAHDVWLHSLSPYRPRIRVSKDIRVPMAVGMAEPTILLPVSWRLWGRDKLRATLIHEMEHVKRGDPETAFLASAVVCLLWLNPFVYWLRKQLAAIAEQACDEAVIVKFRPEQYAHILMEFAAEVGRMGSRLAAASPVASYGSLIKTRLQHMFSVRRHGQPTPPLVRALLISTLIPTLYVTASGRFDGGESPFQADQNTRISIGTQQEADQLEARLLQTPDDLSIRGALMAFYANQGNEAAFTPHLLWVIDQHPEAPIAAMKVYFRGGIRSLPDSLNAHISRIDDDERVNAAWERAIGKNPNSPDVLYHAGLFLEGSDARLALDLFSRAGSLSPVNSAMQLDCLHATAVIYAAAIMPTAHLNSIAMDQNLADTLRGEIGGSVDATLLVQVGRTLVEVGQDREGLSLIQRAIDLDPGNPSWKEALDWAKAEPVRRQNREQVLNGTPEPGIRIGAAVAESNLITKIAPVYPALALQARVRGTVEFTVRIGADGKVESVKLVRGHPLLVSAAKAAVLQWVYRPTLLDGKPVAVTTTVDVPFTIP